MYLEVKDLKKSYGEGGGYVQVLKGITAGVEKGEMCVIQGTSGSGKSTLLNCIGGLDTVDSGSIVVDGMEVAGLGSKALSDYRRNKLGFIFQFYNLVPNLTVKEKHSGLSVSDEKSLGSGEIIAGTWSHGTSEQVPCTTVRWTTAALCHCQSTDQKSQPSVVR